MKRWVTFGRTESGDDIVPIIWDTQPPAHAVEEAYEALYREEYACGLGVSWTAMEAEEAVLV
jgi:hypothetical protein|nr:hypothetical protein [Neorhizobium tomejilense]